MEKQISLRKNFVMNSILTMSSFIFPLVTFPYISRILMPLGTGKVSFATSLISYFNMIAQLGIPTYGIRACAKVRDNKKELNQTVFELFFINIVMTIISYCLLIFSLFSIPKLYKERTLYLIVSLTILLNTIGMEWLYKALERYTYIAIRSILFKLLALFAMFFFIHNENDYVIYGGITIFAASASNILNFVNAKKYVNFKSVKALQIRRHLKPVLIFFAMVCATTIYTHLDTVMLGFMTTNEEVGYYNVAVKIKGILVSIVTSLGTVLLPRVSYYIQAGKINEFRRITKKALEFVFIIASPLTLYFIIFAKQGIYFLSGPAYSASIIPMKIIMPTLLLIGISNILGIQILVPLGKEKIVLYSEIAGAITDLLLNAILIPNMASKGAALGTLFAEAVVVLVQCLAISNNVFSELKQVNYLKIILALSVGGILSFWCKELTMSNFGTLLLSAILFFTAYIVCLFITKEPIVIEFYNSIKQKIHI